MQRPKTFPGQKPDEKIEVFLRRHWLSFLPTILISFFMLLIPLFVFLGLRILGINLGEFENIIILGISCYLLIVLAFYLTSFIDYYLDICIVTDKRIVDIEQNGLFNRVISEQNLIRVQDVTAKRRGILQTFFNFGDLFIQTAGEAPNFEFLAIPRPNEAAQIILKLHQDVLAKGYIEPEEKPPMTPKPQSTPEKPEEELKEIPKI